RVDVEDPAPDVEELDQPVLAHDAVRGLREGHGVRLLLELLDLRLAAGELPRLALDPPEAAEHDRGQHHAAHDDGDPASDRDLRSRAQSPPPAGPPTPAGRMLT